MIDWHITQNDTFLQIMKDRLLGNRLIWVDQFIQIINEYIISNNVNYLKINDIGCNVGHFFRGVIDIKSNIDYIGYDLSKTYIDIAKENFGNFFICLDISKDLPRKCDISVISATLEHIEEYYNSLVNIFESTDKMVIIRTFIGNASLKDYYLKEGASESYIIRQFKLGDILDISNKLGWTCKIVDDFATQSIKKNIGNNIFRTQKVLVFNYEYKL